MGNIFEKMLAFLSDDKKNEEEIISKEDDSNINLYYERKGNYLVDVLASLSERNKVDDQINDQIDGGSDINIINPVSEENDKNLEHYNYMNESNESSESSESSESNESSIDEIESTKEEIIETVKKHFQKNTF